MLFNTSESVQIVKCQELLNNIELNTSLSFISSSFKVLFSEIKMSDSETKGLTQSAAMNVIDYVHKDINRLYDKRYCEKLSNVLRNSFGFSSLKVRPRSYQKPLSNSQMKFHVLNPLLLLHVT